jgi:hypothetical protein
MAQLAQTTAAIQAQLAQVYSAMSGLTAPVGHQVQTTSIFQAQPSFSTPITPSVPALAPSRIPLEGVPPSSVNPPVPVPGPLQAVPSSAPGNFDAMRPPSNRSQQPNTRAPKGVPYGYSVMRF